MVDRSGGKARPDAFAEIAASALDLLGAVHHPNLVTLWQTPVGLDDAACATRKRCANSAHRQVHPGLGATLG